MTVQAAAGRAFRQRRDFTLLWTGQAISDVGSAVTVAVMPLLAITALHASTFQVGLLTASATLGWLLFALPAGMIVDRGAKRSLMIRCDLARLAILASLLAFASLGQLALVHLYVACAALGILTVFFEIAGQSFTPAVLAPDELVAGNTRLFTTNALASVVGAPLAGGLMLLGNPTRVLLVDCFSFLVSIVSLMLVRAPELPRRTKGAGLRMRDELGEGLSFIFGHAVLRRVVACSAVTNLCNTVITALVVVLLVRDLGADTSTVGLVIGIGAIGGVLGGVVANPLARRIGSARLLWLGKLGLGGFLLLIPFGRAGWGLVLVGIGMFAMSSSFVLYNVLQITYRQSVCPPELLGRMNAGVRWVIRSAIPLGGFLAGALGSWIGIRQSLAVAAVGSWLAVLWIVFSPLRRMRDIPVRTERPSA